MHAGDDDIEASEQILLEVERAVFQDVDLHPGQDPERRERGAHLVDLVELGEQPFAIEPMRNGQTGGVIGENEVLVSEALRGASHRFDRRAAVRPYRVGVAVALQLSAHRGGTIGHRELRLGFELGEVAGHDAGEGLGDDLRR